MRCSWYTLGLRCSCCVILNRENPIRNEPAAAPRSLTPTIAELVPSAHPSPTPKTRNLLRHLALCASHPFPFFVPFSFLFTPFFSSPPDSSNAW